jgi:hypothetical protein
LKGDVMYSKVLTRGLLAVLAAGTLTMVGVSAAGSTPAVHRQTTSTTVDTPEVNDTPDTVATPEANDTPDTPDTVDEPDTNTKDREAVDQNQHEAGSAQDPQD